MLLPYSSRITCDVNVIRTGSFIVDERITTLTDFHVKATSMAFLPTIKPPFVVVVRRDSGIDIEVGHSLDAVSHESNEPRNPEPDENGQKVSENNSQYGQPK